MSDGCLARLLGLGAVVTFYEYTRLRRKRAELVDRIAAMDDEIERRLDEAVREGEMTPREAAATRERLRRDWRRLERRRP